MNKSTNTIWVCTLAIIITLFLLIFSLLSETGNRTPVNAFSAMTLRIGLYLLFSLTILFSILIQIKGKENFFKKLLKYPEKNEEQLLYAIENNPELLIKASLFLSRIKKEKRKNRLDGILTTAATKVIHKISSEELEEIIKSSPDTMLSGAIEIYLSGNQK